MDPYCVLTTREQTFKTAVKQGAGKVPKWNQEFEIDVKYFGDDLTIKVYDEDVTSSDFIGEC